MKLQYAVPVLQYSSTVLDHLRCQDADRDAGTMEHLEYFEWVDEKPGTLPCSEFTVGAQWTQSFFGASPSYPMRLSVPNWFKKSDFHYSNIPIPIFQCVCWISPDPNIPISQSQYSNACAEFPQIPISQYPNISQSQYSNACAEFPQIPISQYPPQYSNACAEFPQIPISQYPNPNIPMLVLNFPRSQYPNVPISIFQCLCWISPDPNIPISQSQYSNACAEFPQILISQYPNIPIPIFQCLCWISPDPNIPISQYSNACAEFPQIHSTTSVTSRNQQKTV